jgi:hypothetical protein
MAIQLGSTAASQVSPSPMPNQTPSNFLGMGQQYQFSPYQVNSAAFSNPVGNIAPAWQSAMGQYLGANTMAAPTVAPTDLSMVQPGYQGQMAAANMYGQLANGGGPSLAALQAQQSGQQNLAAALSLAGSQRGGNPALTNYNTQQQLAGINQQTAMNAVQGRTAEQLNALQGLAGSSAGAAGTGLQAAGLQQQQALGSAGIQQQQQAQNAAAWNSYLNQLYGQNQQQFAANQNLQNLAANQALQYNQLGAQQFQNQAASQGAFTSGIVNGLGQAATKLAPMLGA